MKYNILYYIEINVNFLQDDFNNKIKILYIELIINKYLNKIFQNLMSTFKYLKILKTYFLSFKMIFKITFCYFFLNIIFF